MSALDTEREKVLDETEIGLIKRNYKFLEPVHRYLNELAQLENKPSLTNEESIEHVTSLFNFNHSLRVKEDELKSHGKIKEESDRSQLLEFLEKVVNMNRYFNPTLREDRRKLKDMLDRALDNTK